MSEPGTATSARLRVVARATARWATRLAVVLAGAWLGILLLGKAVHVHPLAVVLAIAAGLLVAGIFGALIAVPVVACANVAGTYLSRRHDGPRPPEPRPDRAKPAVGVRG